VLILVTGRVKVADRLTVIAIDPCKTRMVLADRFLLLVRSLELESELLRHAMSRIREGEAWRAEIAALPAGGPTPQASVQRGNSLSNAHACPLAGLSGHGRLTCLQ
jgi:hypothetical protein